MNGSRGCGVSATLRAAAAVVAIALALAPPALGVECGDVVERHAVTVDDAALAAAFGAARRDEMRRRLAQATTGVVVEGITYVSEGLRVKGYLARPATGSGLPCVIFNRGGNRDFGALDDVRASLLLGPMAARGYVVVASQYRGVAGGEGTEEFGGREIADVLNLVPLLEKEPRADASRIGIFGWSRGGLMTYLALARSDRFAAAVVGAGITDSFDLIERRPEMGDRVYAELVPEWDTDRRAALEARSPILWADALSKETPILLLHGSSDWRVDPTQALRMAAALYAIRQPFRFVFFEGGDHALSEHRAEVDRLVGEWLDRYVRDGEPWPSLEPHGP